MKWKTQIKGGIVVTQLHWREQWRELWKGSLQFTCTLVCTAISVSQRWRRCFHAKLLSRQQRRRCVPALTWCDSSCYSVTTFPHSVTDHMSVDALRDATAAELDFLAPWNWILSDEAHFMRFWMWGMLIKRSFECIFTFCFIFVFFLSAKIWSWSSSSLWDRHDQFYVFRTSPVNLMFTGLDCDHRLYKKNWIKRLWCQSFQVSEEWFFSPIFWTFGGPIISGADSTQPQLIQKWENWRNERTDLVSGWVAWPEQQQRSGCPDLVLEVAQ